MAAKVLKGEAKASEQNFETITEPGFYVNNKKALGTGISGLGGIFHEFHYIDIRTGADLWNPGIGDLYHI